MTAQQVHAVIVAGLADPELLTRWRTQPDLLRALGVDPSTFDLTAIWKFAGLSTKIRHNFLRHDLPMTFRLLDVSGLEIEVFGHYASHPASLRKRAAAPDEKIRVLMEFLEQWLNFDDEKHALLWDVIRHELSLAHLGKRALTSSEIRADKAIGRAVTRQSVPHIVGETVLHVMSFDPRVACKKLRDKSPKLSDIPRASYHLCYWWNHREPEVKIVDLDEAGFYLLSLVNGERSVAELNRLLGGGRQTAPLSRVLRDFQTVGILDMRTEPEHAPHASR